MARPYSMDLRERAVGAVEIEGLSRRGSAARYGVAVSTVIKWMRRVRETGSARPGRMGGYKPSGLRSFCRISIVTEVVGAFLRGVAVEEFTDAVPERLD